ncbi:hypothetical protein D9615_009473 [Tricholomella constricta]|uniref:Uncharacterized protein n=1 Tax=Tricholomella constricta TaxID=117010 RepID=A0A8H5LXS0_9AGAR|nr:hypothetical protein D9615_009473 [Tricholomella constricta]
MTRLSADKATGEPAPRMPLVAPKKRKAAIEAPQPGNRHSGRIESLKKKAKTTDEAANPPPDNNGAATEPMEVDGEKESNQSETRGSPSSKFCAGCRNGGTLVECRECPKVVCNRCVTFPEVMDPDETFICPPCHFQPGGKKSEPVIKPYYGFSKATKPTLLLGGPTTREAFALCSTPTVVVISLRLASVDPDGDSARTVFHNIAPYLPKRVKFIDLPWDLGSDKTFKEYLKNVDVLVNRLKNGDLKDYRTFAVYLTDHSDPSRGDLHFTVNGQGAATVAQVMKNLFPASLTDILREGSRNTLTMLVCGAIISVKDAYVDIKAFADRGLFSWVMAFGQAHMQPCLTNPLLQSASVSWFIHERPWHAVLDDFQAVGAHTDVYMLQQGKKTVRYVWVHPSSKPFGEPAPYSCPGCCSYKAWGKPVDIQWEKSKKKKKIQATAITHRCGHCQRQLVYRLKQSFVKHSKGRTDFSGRGEWYSEDKAEN